MTLDTSKAQLFLDCDGVLADFDRGVHRIFGVGSRTAREQVGNHAFWRTLRSEPNFYGTLPLLPDALELFHAVQHLHPVILTGCPVGGWAEPQKQAWAAQHFPGTRMITCLAREKSLYMRAGDVIVDDYQKYRALWEEAGGIFVHHTSASHTLAQLRGLGMLQASPS